jgi:hypothetical protein
MDDVFTFSLLVAGPDLQTEEHLDALFDAGCDDATFGNREKIQYADFDREAPSLAEAIASAIHAIEKTVSGALVFRVEPEEFVSLSAIATRTSRSRESIRLLASGERGPGGFPSPVSWVDAKTRVWRWTDVAQWFEKELGEPPSVSEDAETIATFNGLLETRVHMRRLPREDERDVVTRFAREDHELSELLAV